MLIGFSVSNYKSFYEPQHISLLAGKVTRHKEHVSLAGNRKILKSALIFGANASGKSNLIEAVGFSREIILYGLDKVNLEKKYFRIEKEMYGRPGVFEYRIDVNGIEYSYGLVISYMKREVLSEWLVRVEASGKEICIFNREVDEKGNSFTSTEAFHAKTEESMRMKVYLEDFDQNISDAFRRKTILSDLADRGKEPAGIFAEITEVQKWFKRMIVLFPNSKYKKINEIASNENTRELFSDLISFFDTGIESIEGQQQEMDFEKILENMPEEKREEIRIELSNKVNERPYMIKINRNVYFLRRNEEGNIIYNKMLINHGNLEELFEYEDESDGTKRLFDLIPLFYERWEDSVFLIDEIDRSLHTKVTQQFLKLFYALKGEKRCQMIATTHDSNLLDLDLVRQDEIWFVERQDNHSSKVYSLNKFRARFDKKIDKEYLLGRYGAIPVFKEELDLEGMYEE